MISSFSNIIGLELNHVLKNMNAGKLAEHFRFFLWSLTFNKSFILTDVQFMQTPNDWKNLNFGLKA